MDHFASAAHIVIVAVDLDQARIDQIAVFIVIQAAVLGHDAVLYFRLRLYGVRVRLRYWRVHHFAVLIKGIASLGQKAVGLGDPVGAALDRYVQQVVVIIGKVVIISVDHDQTRIVHDDAVFDQICIFLVVIEAGTVLLPNAVFIEGIEHVLALNVEGIYASCRIFAGTEVIFFAVNGHPLLGHPLAGPHIFDAFFIVDKIPAGQVSVRENVMISADGLLAVKRSPGIQIKIIVICLAGDCVVNRAPSGFQRAVDRVVGIAVQFKQTCYLALRYAVLSEVVVIAVLFILIARDLANTSHRYVINEVVEIISGLSPALPTGLVQGKAVFKCGVGGPEVGALFIGIVGVDEGDQAIGLLNAGIAGNGI